MELPKELIETQKFTEDQVKAIATFGKTQMDESKAKIEEEWKGKAHNDAQGILDGAGASVEKLTGIKRNSGEKIADYIDRSNKEFSLSKSKELDQLKTDYEDKIKNVKDAGTLKEEYEKMKIEKDEILKKFADYDTLKEKASKADEYGTELSGLKLEVAFSNVKPTFPDTVNSFESKARWDEFKADILSKNTIEIVDGQPIAIDKENKYKQTKLSELVEKNDIIQALLKGRQQEGTGAKAGVKVKIEGLPFELKEKGTTKDNSESIREYLATQGISITHPDYAKKFAEYTKLIAQQKA